MTFYFRTPFEDTPRVSLGDFEETKTMPYFTDECDINKIMLKYHKSGTLSHINSQLAQYVDNPSVVDYHTALLMIESAEDAFATLPSAVRARFANDPGSLHDFVRNPNNRQEAIDLGLIAPNPSIRGSEEPPKVDQA